MTCPHCGHPIETPQQRWQAQARARGCCTQCGRAHRGRHWRCRACRLQAAAAARRRYRRKGLA